MHRSGVAGFDELVVEGGITLDLGVADKAALLAALAGLGASATGIDASLILERVRLRESLGATGFGGGTAIPHARLAELSGVVVQVVRLAAPVDYGALDDLPVDIVVLLLSPEDAGADHLKALARISRTLRDPKRLAAMRAAADVAAMRKAIVTTTANGEAGRRAA
jgi:PTS system nitrogen regulatory IIA component